MTHQKTFSGFVAIVGRPNVGKSTMLNAILGQKISITSRKPQTTRHRLLGIHTEDAHQLVFIDTPGIHKGESKAINKYMNKSAISSMGDVDCIIMVIEAEHWRELDQYVLEHIKKTKTNAILFINKIDKIKDKKSLLPFIEEVAKQHDFQDIILGSAKSSDSIKELVKRLQSTVPENIHLFPDDQVTDKNLRFLVSEIIREKVFRLTGEELPYSTTVVIEQYKPEEKITRIAALIYVEKPGQKAIVIGKGGAKLKEIGTAARHDIEKLIDHKVFLQCWVKVKTNWSDDNGALANLGYVDE